MGIFGLTSYISQHQAEFLDDYKLFDSPVLIDGNSAASLIYSNLTQSNHAFGGDYDKYAQSTRCFVKLLVKCGITPIFIFDGGYETRKLKTVLERIRMNIIVCGQYKNKYRESKSFPLLLRDSFRSILNTLKVCVIQCDFEADNELVVLSRILNCPVISSDSDFYISDSLYIPFMSIDFKAVRFKKKSRKRKFYLMCKIFNHNKFLDRFGVCDSLNKSLLPLLSCALGNDYIPPNSFKNFLKLNRLMKFDDRIAKIIQWLSKISSVEEAVRQMVACVERHNCSMKLKITNLLTDYNRKTSDLLNYLPSDIVEKFVCHDLTNLAITNTSAKLENIKSAQYQTCQSDSDSSFNYEESSEDDDIIVLDVEEYEICNSDNDDGNDEDEAVNCSTHLTSIDFDETSILELTKKSENSIFENGVLHDSTNSSINADNTLNKSELNGVEGDATLNDTRTCFDSSRITLNLKVPEWFLKKYRQGLIAPNIINVINFQRIFIPSQSEDYFSKPSHEICLPILEIIVGIILGKDSAVSKVKCHARYKNINLGVYDIIPRFEVLAEPLPSLDTVTFTPVEVRSSILLNCLNLSNDINLKLFPREWRLFVIMLMYWKKHCNQPTINGNHIRAVILCLIYLSVVDRKAGFARSTSDLKRIRKERKSSMKLLSPQTVEEELPVIEDELFNIECEYNSIDDYVDRISEEDCHRIANALLGYHQVNPNLIKNRKDFDLKVIHSFAQLQHCILSISMLNSVLDFPFLPCQPHSCFSGTFLYNFYSELNHRKLADGYITRTLLTKANTIISLYRYLIASWEAVALTKLIRPKFVIKKRKKGKKSESRPLETIIDNDVELEPYTDPDNIYSMLPEE